MNLIIRIQLHTLTHTKNLSNIYNKTYVHLNPFLLMINVNSHLSNLYYANCKWLQYLC